MKGVMETETETETVNWPHKSPGYYVKRLNKRAELTGYLTPQGGWSMYVRLATMFETKSAAELAAKLRSNSAVILANRVPA